MIDNLLTYPSSCLVGKTVPKKTFTQHLDLSTSVRQHLQDDILSFTWLYKIAPTTLQVQAAPAMPEIEVFLAQCKSDSTPLDAFIAIDKYMPQFLVFILQHADTFHLLINYKQWADTEHTHFNIIQTFVTPALQRTELTLPIQGTELPTIYDNFVRHIAGNNLPSGSNNPLQADVLTFQQQKAIEKRMAQLTQQMRREQQPNRKFILHQQINQLRNELNSIWKN